MGDSIGPPRPSATPPSGEYRLVRGSMLGTAIVGGISYFVERWGPAAAHTLIARLPPGMRAYVQPNAPVLGILGAKKYPYAFVGELIRTAAVIAKLDEDQACALFAVAGSDHALTTVNRVILRYAASPRTLADRAQELWDMFHDSGRVAIRWVGEKEYLTTVSDWPSHDVVVCKLCAEARRAIISRTGVKGLEVRRERCQAWGHDVCESRVRWG